MDRYLDEAMFDATTASITPIYRASFKLSQEVNRRLTYKQLKQVTFAKLALCGVVNQRGMP
jgi:hypothetical protein